MPETVDKEIIDGERVTDLLIDVFESGTMIDGKALETFFNAVCSAQIKFLGDDKFEITYA